MKTMKRAIFDNGLEDDDESSCHSDASTNHQELIKPDVNYQNPKSLYV
jgi:hypothetical protein